MLDLLEIPLSQNKDFPLINLKFGNEIFLTSGNDQLPTAFQENRLLFSPTAELSKKFKIGLTWNRQYGATSDQDIFNLMHVLFIEGVIRLI